MFTQTDSNSSQPPIRSARPCPSIISRLFRKHWYRRLRTGGSTPHRHSGPSAADPVPFPVSRAVSRPAASPPASDVRRPATGVCPFFVGRVTLATRLDGVIASARQQKGQWPGQTGRAPLRWMQTAAACRPDRWTDRLREQTDAQSSVLNPLCSFLAPRCSVLVPRSSILCARFLFLGPRPSILGARCSFLVPRSLFLDSRFSVLGARPSVLGARSSVLGHGLDSGERVRCLGPRTVMQLGGL